MANWFIPASSLPFSPGAGNVPNVGEALIEWFQPMVFKIVTKAVVNYQAVETAVEVSFRGVFQPFSDRQLLLKPEGERAWSWYWIHSDPSLMLDVDDVIEYQGKNYRVMSLKNYSLYGYMDYHVITDYTGSDPVVTP